MIKPHVKLNTQLQKDPVSKLKFNYGFGEDEEEADGAIKNYYTMAQAFQTYLTNFQNDYRTRVAERNPQIEVADHIEYIQILFQSQFVISNFYEQWANEFGLLGIQFSKFNNELLFAIIDRNKFNIFINEVNKFIQKEVEGDRTLEYSSKIVYIKEFKLLSTADIIQYRQIGQLMNIRLIDDFPLDSKIFASIFNSLTKYLDDNNIQYSFDEQSRNMEVIDATMNQLIEIIKNFDIVLNVTSSLATVISPSGLNQPNRSYGFRINNINDNLPIIGIIDTGISEKTPLSPIILKDERFNLTSTSVLQDDTNHGTAIGALAALGKKAYTSGYRGNIEADAKLLSIKVMDNASSYLSQKAVLDLLRKAKLEFPSIKIFVLTICYEAHKRDNEDFSAYAYELDRFSHLNDCIICICTANNDSASLNNVSYDLNYFHNENTNICSPAESMNNITVGAAANSLRIGDFEGISISKEFPALYSRKGHIDLTKLFPKNKVNKLYFKPDIIECGGDYEYNQAKTYIAAGTKASMEVLSSIPTESFYCHVGTSFSAPLVANIAAQIQRNYPNIKAQSFKALIINGASANLIRFPNQLSSLLNKTAGHGLTDEQKSVYSNDNSITFLLEESIEPEQIRIFPINFPQYLTAEDLGKKRGILKITATLCFSFNPLLNHQLAYCPIHMAFCIFKNQTADQIMATEEDVASLLKSNLRWSQNGRYIGKPIPYTNTQKLSFSVNFQDLINESSTFKIAVNCRINPQLLPGTERQYQSQHSFSIALTVEETLKENNLTGKLYNEMMLCNSVENIAAINMDIEGTAEVDA